MFERIRNILIKEFIQVFRDPRMRMVIFVAPMLQVMVFGYAVTTDVKNIPTAVYDLDRSADSRNFIREFTYSKYFDVKKYIYTDQEQKTLVDKSVVNVIIRINRGFAQDIKAGKSAQFQLIVDGTDSNTAAITLNYAAQIAERYSSRLLNRKSRVVLNKINSLPKAQLRTRAWFNENLESRNFYIPGVMALTLMLVTLLLTSMAIVREKEIGTIEQLIVSPIKPFELIFGKLLPFAIIGFVVAILVTLIGVFWFKVPLRGNPFLLLGAIALYITTTLGIGLFISTLAGTQQEAMMSTFFFFFPAVLLSGFLFPISNMPGIIQFITYINPLRYFLVILRGIFLKGVGFWILWPQMLALLIMGVAIVTISSLKFRKMLG